MRNISKSGITNNMKTHPPTAERIARLHAM